MTELDNIRLTLHSDTEGKCTYLYIYLFHLKIFLSFPIFKPLFSTLLIYIYFYGQTTSVGSASVIWTQVPLKEWACCSCIQVILRFIRNAIRKFVLCSFSTHSFYSFVTFYPVREVIGVQTWSSSTNLLNLLTAVFIAGSSS